MSKPPPNRPPDHIDSPTAWMCAYEAAIKKGDLQAAAHAERELRRLGVRVTWHRRRLKKTEGGDDE